MAEEIIREILDRLISIEQQVKAVLEQAKRTNGTVIDHDRWKCAHQEICNARGAEFRNLQTQVAGLVEESSQRRGSLLATKVIFAAIGAGVASILVPIVLHFLK